jgi:hypothetical protein
MHVVVRSKLKTTRFDASRGIAKSRHCAAELNALTWSRKTQHKSRMHNCKYHAKTLDLETWSSAGKMSSPAGVTDELEILTDQAMSRNRTD